MPTRLDLIRLTSWESYQVPFTAGDDQPLPPFVRRYLRALEWLRRPKHSSSRSEFEKEVNELVLGARNACFEMNREVRLRIEKMAPRGWYRTHFVEPLEKLTRPIGPSKEPPSPELALRAAYATTSDADVDDLITRTERSVDATDERLLAAGLPRECLDR